MPWTRDFGEDRVGIVGRSLISTSARPQRERDGRLSRLVLGQGSWRHGRVRRSVEQFR